MDLSVPELLINKPNSNFTIRDHPTNPIRILYTNADQFMNKRDDLMQFMNLK